MSCRDLEKQALETQDLSALLNKSAHESLRSLADILVPITKMSSTGTKKYSVDGSAFWQIAAGDDFGPALVAPLVADAIPNGRLERFDDLDHFGPLEDPARFADRIAALARSLGGKEASL